MQTKKTTMLAAGLVVAVIAMAGVGYAAVVGTYYATTTNEDNSMASAYIELSQAGNAMYTKANFLKDVPFDTVDTSTYDVTNGLQSSHEYTLVSTHIYATGTPATYTASESARGNQNGYTLIGEGLILNATKVNSENAQFSMIVTTDLPNVLDSYVLVLDKTNTANVITADATADLSGGKFTFSTLAWSSSWTVYLFAKGTMSVAPDDQTNGFNSNDVTFTFELKATATAQAQSP